MAFEYGCSTMNKFSLMNASEELEDPSEILAQMQLQKEQAAKDAKSGKVPVKKTDAKSATGAKDAKKQPLQQQQQADNSSKTGAKNDIKKDDRQNKPRNLNGDRKQHDNTPREGKENTTGFGDFKEVRDQQRDRRPRPEGEGGFRRDNQDRPPRRAPGQGGFGGDRPRGPPRSGNFGRRTDAEGNEQTGGNQVAEFSAEGAPEEGGFRRSGGNAGGFRGPRPQGERNFNRDNNREGGFRGERREGGFRGERRTDAGEGGFHNDKPRFDRHSGSERTGVKAVDKKEGAGKSNWGTYNDELVAEGDAVTETQTGEPVTGDWAARVDENDEKKEETEESGEVVPNFMTLAEYKALQNEINKKNAFNIRRAGEGEDQAKWKNTYVLPKKPAEDDEEEEYEEEEEEEEDEEEAKKKSLLKLIQIKFNEPVSKGRDERGGDRRGERGERGAPRGDRGDRQPRGEPRERRQFESAPAEHNTSTEHADDAQASPDKRRQDNRPQRGGFNAQRPQGQQRPGQHQTPRQNKVAPRIADENDFPSLGAK